jgi:hypothetical protein
MRYNRVLLMLAAIAVVGITWTIGAGADERRAEDKHAGHFDGCAKECANCMRECESCARHCMDQVNGGKQDHFATLQSCSDCADMCAAAGKIVARRGPMAGIVCEACAKACNVCGTACEKFPSDQHMTQCAKACRECEKACREMLKHTGSDTK